MILDELQLGTWYMLITTYSRGRNTYYSLWKVRFRLTSRKRYGAKHIFLSRGWTTLRRAMQACTMFDYNILVCKRKREIYTANNICSMVLVDKDYINIF